MKHPLTKLATTRGEDDPRVAGLQSLLGQAITIARLKKKLRDRENRLGLIRLLLSDGDSWSNDPKRDMLKAANLRQRDWKLEV